MNSPPHEPRPHAPPSAAGDPAEDAAFTARTPPGCEAQNLPPPTRPTVVRAPRLRNIAWGMPFLVAALLLDPLVVEALREGGGRDAFDSVLATLDGLAPVAIIIAVLAAQLNARRLCIGFVVTLAVHLPVLHGLKWAIGRARPRADLGTWHFAPLSGGDLDAFPSGHTTTAAVFALLLGIYFPRARWVFYAWAALVGLRRVVDGWHYMSDVVAGFLLAALVVHTCVRLLGPAYFSRQQPTHTPSQRPLT